MHDDVSALVRDGELINLPGSANAGPEAKSLGSVARSIKSALDLLDSCFRAVLVLALVTELAIVLTEIFSRFWFQTSLLWSDEAAKLFLSLIAFVGGALAYRARHHTTVEFFTGKLPARHRLSVAIAIDLLVLIAAAMVGYISLDLLSIAATSNTPILGINAAWLIVPLAIGLTLVIIFALERLINDYTPQAMIPAACVVAVLLGIVYAISIFPALHFSSDTTLAVMLVAFLA